MQTKFILKPEQTIEFTEEKVSFKIKNNSTKDKYIKIEIK